MTSAPRILTNKSVPLFTKANTQANNNNIQANNNNTKANYNYTQLYPGHGDWCQLPRRLP